MKSKQETCRKIREAQNAQEVFDAIIPLMEETEEDLMKWKNGTRTAIQREIDDKFWNWLETDKNEAFELYKGGILSKSIQKGEFCTIQGRLMYFKNWRYKMSYLNTIHKQWIL